ncbi:MAG: transcription termination/antitermination protein NusG [Phycisphaerales bacterium]|nr:transcription termination/antitermination protein NusG [Phycisphaerales bacterium]
MNIMTDQENNIETPSPESSETQEVTETSAHRSSETLEVSKETATEVSPEVSTPQETAAEVSSEVSTPKETPQAPVPVGEEPKTQLGMNWFVLRVASNKEDYVKSALDRKVEIEAMQHLVGRIMVPTEKTKTLSKTGKAKITETKLYPGYIFVEMKLEEQRISQDVFFLIKETTGVGDFVGTAGKPTPMSNDEVDKMLFDSQAPDEVAEVKLEFEVGDHVNIKEGPFMGYEGTVDEIFPEKGVVKVLATVFGRQTSIEIEYWMIEKTE